MVLRVLGLEEAGSREEVLFVVVVVVVAAASRDLPAKTQWLCLPVGPSLDHVLRQSTWKKVVVATSRLLSPDMMK